MARKKREASGRAAFTLMELLVVVAIMTALLFVSLIGFERVRPKMQLTGAAQELAVSVQRARMTAIRQQKQVTVKVENVLGGDVTYYNPTGIQQEFMVFSIREPDGEETEFLSYSLPKGFRPVYLWGHGEEKVQGASAITFSSDLTITPTGTVRAVGAFRLSYPQTDAQRNVLEVAIQTVAGQPVIRKYLMPGDRPTTAPAQNYFQETVASVSGPKNLWVWY